MISKTLQRIVYVEDEPDIQAVARIALEAVGGFSVLICSSGAEALEKAGAFKPDLLLLDVMMPGMDGPGTLAALRTQPGLDRTPAMFMTAKVQPAEVAHFKSLGAVDVIPKPFDPMTLSNQIREAWARVQSNG
jgi:two-component system, OmpR family, response regulator